MQLDSKAPSIPLREYRMNETRFRVLTQTHPIEAEAFLHDAEREVRHRWRELERLAGITEPHEAGVSADD
jgi:pyruvate-ferredoxin/flavodoxin oxidoreductase